MKKVSIPGSKSYTNRALLLAAMSNRKVKILNPLISDDTKAMIDCLNTLGVSILERKDCIEVSGNFKNIPHRSYNLNANLSGTTLRFLLALSTIIPGTKTLSGKEGLNKRPIEELVSGLTQLGAKIEYLKKKGFPPVRILSSKLNPGTIKIKGSISSQYISAILMIAPLVGEVTIEITGNQISKPYIDMTIDIMKQFGVAVLNQDYKKYHIKANQKYSTGKYLVEGDLSSAGYFLAIAALTKSTLTLENINPDSKQADIKFVKLLESMGNKITFGKNRIVVQGKGVKPVTVEMTDCPDQIQTLAVLAAFASGITRISGVQSLRIKETDRIAALKKELKKMGIKTSSTKNTLTVYGGNPKAARIDTFGDHRMAMSFAVAGTKLSGMEIVNPEVVNKTFPDFWKKLNSINPKNIILIGMRGSGKTTVAKILARKLNKQHVELDELIVKKVRLTVPEIVAKYGWDFFRDKESEVVQGVSSNNSKIISTGGGMVTRSQNIDALRKNGVFIYLNASSKVLVKRIGEDLNRPLLTNAKSREEEVENLLLEREKLYRKTADKTVETDTLNPNEVAERIILKLTEGV